MDIQAILFDKDGTLMKFDRYWVEVSRHAVNDILRQIDREDIPTECLLAALGVKDGIADTDGLLCKGTYEQIGLALNEVLREHGADVSEADSIKMTLAAYDKNADTGKVEPVCENLREVLLNLKRRGRRLAVVTTDNASITAKCLEKLGIADVFDKVYTDNGQTPVKPDPWCAKDFLNRCGIAPQNALMVGDTMTDVRFARNAGIAAIGVGEKPDGRERLVPYADAVLPDISHLADFIAEA